MILLVSPILIIVTIIESDNIYSGNYSNNDEHMPPSSLTHNLSRSVIDFVGLGIIYLSLFGICCIIVYDSMKKLSIECQIGPTFKTFKHKIKLQATHLQCIENCYQSMVSYEIKCQILQQYLWDIQGIACIIVDYLPQLREIKYDIADELDRE